MLPPPLQSSLPAGWLASTGRELNPLDRYKRFQITFSSPFSGLILAQGTIFIFRSKRADRLKIVAWDGSGLVLLWKRLEHGAFRWPPISDGVMRLTASQLAALVDGMDWSRLLRGQRPRRELLRPFESLARGLITTVRESGLVCA
jgi:hypothetical protein